MAESMKVYQALAEGFVAEGTTDLFCLMGGGNLHWIVACQQYPHVRLYDVHHEGAGLAMADGWARVSGKPGVCTVTSGPGLTHLATSLVVARRASTPIVVFAADLPEGGPDHQLLDQARFAQATEAGFVRINAADSAYDTVRKAFYLARTESRPVILDAPMDILEMDYNKFQEYRPSTSLVPAIQRIQPDPAQIAKAACFIKESKKPVIIAGRGAALAGAQDAVLRLAERTGSLISTSVLTKGFLADAEFHAGIAGQFASQAAAAFFAQADCVIGIGTSLNYFTLGGGRDFFANARFIQIDQRPRVLMGNGRVADCYVQGDARVTVDALVDLLAKESHQATGLRTPEVHRSLTKDYETSDFVVEEGAVDPRQAALVLDDALSAEIGLVVGNGHFTGFLMPMRRQRTPFIATLAFGCIGQGLSTAIGATIAAKRPLALIEGDGGMLMQIQELDTLARYNVPLLVIIMNDQALGGEYHRLPAQEKDLARMTTPDFAAVARSFGLRGHLIRNIDGLRPALEDFTRTPGPMVVDLRISRSVVSLAFQRHFLAQVANGAFPDGPSDRNRA